MKISKWYLLKIVIIDIEIKTKVLNNNNKPLPQSKHNLFLPYYEHIITNNIITSFTIDITITSFAKWLRLFWWRINAIINKIVIVKY
jgi:hypothetical protein